MNVVHRDLLPHVTLCSKFQPQVWNARRASSAEQGSLLL